MILLSNMSILYCFSICVYAFCMLRMPVYIFCIILSQVNEIESILRACIGLCQRNTPRLNPEESEILWFRLLDSYVHHQFSIFFSWPPNCLLSFYVHVFSSCWSLIFA